MTAPQRQLSDVANAAPITPHPKGNMKSQSNTTLTKAEIILHHMASLGEPSNRMANKATATHN